MTKPNCDALINGLKERGILTEYEPTPDEFKQAVDKVCGEEDLLWKGLVSRTLEGSTNKWWEKVTIKEELLWPPITSNNRGNKDESQPIPIPCGRDVRSSSC